MVKNSFKKIVLSIALATVLVMASIPVAPALADDVGAVPSEEQAVAAQQQLEPGTALQRVKNVAIPHAAGEEEEEPSATVEQAGETNDGSQPNQQEATRPTPDVAVPDKVVRQDGDGTPAVESPVWLTDKHQKALDARAHPAAPNSAPSNELWNTATLTVEAVKEGRVAGAVTQPGLVSFGVETPRFDSEDAEILTPTAALPVRSQSSDGSCLSLKNLDTLAGRAYYDAVFFFEQDTGSTTSFCAVATTVVIAIPLPNILADDAALNVLPQARSTRSGPEAIMPFGVSTPLTNSTTGKPGTGAPPQKIYGTFECAVATDYNAGTVPVAYHQGHLQTNDGFEIASWGSNAPAFDDGRLMCLDGSGPTHWLWPDDAFLAGPLGPGTRNWGPVAFSLDWLDEAAGIAWYTAKATHIYDVENPAKQSYQYLGDVSVGIRWVFPKVRFGKYSADPATDHNPSYSTMGTVFQLRGADKTVLATLTTRYALNEGAGGRPCTYTDWAPAALRVGAEYEWREVSPSPDYQNGNEGWRKFTAGAASEQFIDALDAPKKGRLTLAKRSAVTSITSDNACYSLTGATYGVYASKAEAHQDTGRVGTLVTDGSGKATSGELYFGVYHVKEVVASQGYALDPAVYEVSLTAANSPALVNDGAVPEQPVGDPAPMHVQKLDAVTGKAGGLDDRSGRSLAGAQYTWRYFDGYYHTAAAAEASGQPTRTWVFETGDGGYAYFSKSSQVSGDELYFDSDHNLTIPLGTMLIQESKAPDAYLLPDPNPVSVLMVRQDANGKLVRTLSTDGIAQDSVSRLNALVVVEQPHEAEVVKLDHETGAPIPGTGFSLSRESAKGAGDWQQVAAKETGSDGTALFSPLAIGSYRLTEEYPNPFYVVPGEQERSVLFEVTPASGRIVITLDNTSRSLVVSKLDAATKEAVPNTEFALFRESVPEAGDWQLLETKLTGADGTASFAPVEAGSYKVVETRANPEYMERAEEGLPPETCFMVADEETVVAVTFFDHRRVTQTGIKLDADTKAPLPNTEFELLRYPVPVLEGRVDCDLGAIAADDPLWAPVTDRVLTGADGKVEFGGLSFGVYQLRETQPNQAYASYEETGGEPHVFVLDKDSTGEVQVFYDSLIQISCEVRKDTINVTSAAFKTLEKDYLKINNVGTEEFAYKVGFRSTSNVRADEFTVIDPMENALSGQVRLTQLWTPVVYGDTDGAMNLWYRTNLSDPDVIYSRASAMSTNPANRHNPENAQRFSSSGWQLWAQDLPTTRTTHLATADLGLAAGEYVTGVRYEYGSVEVGFTTDNAAVPQQQVWKSPLDWSPYLLSSTMPWGAEAKGSSAQKGPVESSLAQASLAQGLYPAYYLVVCPGEMLPPDEIVSSASAHIARNYVLTDDAVDNVITTVISPFMMTFGADTPTVEPKVSRGTGTSFPKTGDNAFVLTVLFTGGTLIGAVALLSGLSHRRRRRAEGDGKSVLSGDKHST
ncbi:MAG: hypothetical protein LBD25_08305 [Coriobacteriales bacterium]|jgi:hypothetical protein|nr:hypothetical protein [Coriobacteriales bacterium]